MTQPTNNNQIAPLTKFVDSVFTELNHWETEYSYFDCKDLANWKNTLIPLAVNLYELAQTDDAVFWWLLQLMSHVDVCKDRKEDLRKSDVFAVLSKLKQEHQKIILEKCLPTCAEKLQKALENDEQDAFKRILPVIDENDAFYSIGRLLKRVEEVRDIYEKTISHTKGDSLGRLFVLFRRYYEYFANSYDNNQRSCDGMAKNIFLALYQTQYREDNNEFCEVTYNIGELWVRGLVLAYHNYNTQMPPVASDIVLDTLQKQDEEFHKALSNCFSEKQIVSLMEEYGGWLELEEYGFIYNVLQVSKEVRSDTTPPFSCLCTDKKKKRKRICGNVEHRDNREKIHYQDNYIPYIDSINAIPMEELKAVATSEDVQNIQGVLEQPCESTLSIPGRIKLFKDNDCVGEYETVSLNVEKKALFLKELAVVLSNEDCFIQDAQESFIHALDGTTASSGSHSKINWKESAASLFALCYVLFDEKITGKWPIIANLFVVKGKSLDTSNAPKYKKGTNRRSMQNYVKKALEEIGVA